MSTTESILNIYSSLLILAKHSSRFEIGCVDCFKRNKRISNINNFLAYYFDIILFNYCPVFRIEIMFTLQYTPSIWLTLSSFTGKCEWGSSLGVCTETSLCVNSSENWLLSKDAATCSSLSTLLGWESFNVEWHTFTSGLSLFVEKNVSNFIEYTRYYQLISER